MDQQKPTNSQLKQAENLADRTYKPSDYQDKSTVGQALAMTHEQVSDNYMEGTNDGTIDEYAGQKNVAIPRKGYDGMFTDKK